MWDFKLKTFINVTKKKKISQTNLTLTHEIYNYESLEFKLSYLKRWGLMCPNNIIMVFLLKKKLRSKYCI